MIGKFYLHYAGDRKMRVAVSDPPTGPFKDTGKWMFPDLEFSIDGHAFKDPGNGNWYLFFAKDFFDQRPGTALAVVQLADDVITRVGEQKTVMCAFADWQIYERDRDLYNRKWDAWHTVECPVVIFPRREIPAVLLMWKLANAGIRRRLCGFGHRHRYLR